jgi:predicted membrane channel-forming protein YqfA (hemolysin III family)
MDDGYVFLAYIAAGALISGAWAALNKEAHEETPMALFIVLVWPAVLPFMAAQALVTWLKKG